MVPRTNLTQFYCGDNNHSITIVNVVMAEWFLRLHNMSMMVFTKKKVWFFLTWCYDCGIWTLQCTFVYHVNTMLYLVRVNCWIADRLFVVWILFCGYIKYAILSEYCMCGIINGCCKNLKKFSLYKGSIMTSYCKCLWF